MNIEVRRIDVAEAFVEKRVVFKITAKSVDGSEMRNVHMVVDFADYEKRLMTHQYTPLLFAVPLHTRLCYLYGCMNYEYRKPRTEIFTFWWRKIGQDKWCEWFTVKPYMEDHSFGPIFAE